MKDQIKQAKVIEKQMTERVADLAAQLQTIREEIAQQILNLPQNPRITPVGSVAYSIKMSDFGTKNWSASYHDFRAQYRALGELVKKSSPETIIPKLKQALDVETVIGPHRVALHPDVIANVRKLL